MKSFGPHTIIENGSLYQAAELAVTTHWRGTRWGNNVQAYVWPMIAWLQQEKSVRDLDDITPAVLSEFVDHCQYRLRNSKQTITHKRSALRTLFAVAQKNGLTRIAMPAVDVPRGNRTKTLNNAWWLRPDLVPFVVKQLIASGHRPLALYILWVVYTGTRVEENLRLQFNHLSRDGHSLWVPGTKNDKSAATIPISAAAKAIYDAIRADTEGDYMFPISLDALRYLFKTHFIPLIKSTLTKGQRPSLRDLRATFASTQHLKGMPTSILQQLLRHGKIETTMGYIRRTGDLQQMAALTYLNADTKEEAQVKLADFVKSIGWSTEELKRELRRKRN